jgi:cytochrome P450 family 2 subfamily U polypeptide 1
LSFILVAFNKNNTFNLIFFQGSWVIGNLFGCHMDTKHWKDPRKFDPNRFLQQDGKLLEKTPSFLPFSLGQ